MRAVQARVAGVELVREDHHVGEVRLPHEGDPFDMLKIPRPRQGDPHAVRAVGAVGQQALAVIG
jgi:hypothetical protein